MKKINPKIFGTICFILSCYHLDFAQTPEAIMLPHLHKQGVATQLQVAGEPFIVLGGELGNSTFTSVENMAPVWAKLKAMHLNTILAPVYWEIMEPEEGVFDFKLLDALIGEARKNDFKMVLLCFLEKQYVESCSIMGENQSKEVPEK